MEGYSSSPNPRVFRTVNHRRAPLPLPASRKPFFHLTRFCLLPSLDSYSPKSVVPRGRPCQPALGGVTGDGWFSRISCFTPFEWQQRGHLAGPRPYHTARVCQSSPCHARGCHVHVPGMNPLFFPGLPTGKAGPVHLQAAAVQAERGSQREDPGAQQLPSLQRLAVHL